VLRRHLLRIILLATIVGSSIPSACGDAGSPLGPAEPAQPGGGGSVGLQIAGESHRRDGSTLVAVVLDSGLAGMSVLEARLAYDPRAFRLRGQIAEPGRFVTINDQVEGEIRFLAYGLGGLGRRPAVFAFEATGASSSFDRLELDGVAIYSREGARLRPDIGPPELLSQPLPVGSSDPRALSDSDWIRHLDLPVDRARAPEGGFSPERRGDCEPDGALDSQDILRIARISVAALPAPMDPLVHRACDVNMSRVIDGQDIIDLLRIPVSMRVTVVER